MKINRRLFLGSSIAGALAATAPAHRLFALTSIPDDIAAVTGSGAETTLEKSAVDELRKSLRGALLLPGDPGYDDARHLWNDAIDKHPALIVQPTGVADIQNAVTFARERDLLLAVKCGGHSFSGRSTCDGGLQIDLSHLRNVRVDPRTRTAHVAGGSLLGELDREAMAQGLVTTAGTVSHTGVGGLTLAGGFGRVGRRFGLALDNVRGVDLVTADGRLVHASAEENPDLYWAVRGGGGNFGVVTSFEFALHPMQRQVIGGDVIFPLAKARELLRFYGEYCAAAPDEMYTDAVLVAPPGGKPGICLLNVCYSGPPERADAVLAPIRKLGKPMADTIGPIDYVALQKSSDEVDPRIQGDYLKSGFVHGVDEALVASLVDGFTGDSQRATTLYFQQSGGAINRIPAAATAFSHRSASHSVGTVVSWPLDVDPAPHLAWLRDYWSTVEPHTDGYYFNEDRNEPQAVINANYQGNFARLQQIKAKFDPTNLFRLNANVPPAA